MNSETEVARFNFPSLETITLEMAVLDPKHQVIETRNTEKYFNEKNLASQETVE